MYFIIGMILCGILLFISIQVITSKWSYIGWVGLLISISLIIVLFIHSTTVEKYLKKTTAVVINTDTKVVATLKKLDTGGYFYDANGYYTTVDVEGKRQCYDKDNTNIIPNSNKNYVTKTTKTIDYNLDNISKNKKNWSPSIHPTKDETYQIHVTDKK